MIKEQPLKNYINGFFLYIKKIALEYVKQKLMKIHEHTGKFPVTLGDFEHICGEMVFLDFGKLQAEIVQESMSLILVNISQIETRRLFVSVLEW